MIGRSIQVILSRRALLRVSAGALTASVMAACAPSRPGPALSRATRSAAGTGAVIERASTPLAPRSAAGSPTPSRSIEGSPAASPVPSSRRLVAYLAAWSIGAKYRVADVPAEKLTHVNYAFASVSPGGECVSGSVKADQANLPELQRLKSLHPRLSTSISIGGAAKTNHFADAARSDESRRHFAQSAIQFMQDHGFDGIDLDWEYPSGTDQSQSFTQLLAELRRELDARESVAGRHYVLTIAAPAGPNHYLDLQLDQIHPYLDWINLMTYAFHGTWSTITNFNAPLFSSATDPSPILQRLAYNTDAAVQAYLTAGVPSSKIVVGVPFYGVGWQGVPDVNDGLYQQATGAAPGTTAPGTFAYRDLITNYLPSYRRFWHDQVRVPWLYNSGSGIMITYDDPQSLGVKADYARSLNLGGAMIWELSTDDSQHSLVNALHDHLYA